MSNLVKLDEILDFQNRKNEEKINKGGIFFNKKDGSYGYAANLATILATRNGTIFWDVYDPTNGDDHFDNIFQYIAADIYVPGSKPKIRSRIGAEREHEVRSGLTTLAKNLDYQVGIPLFRINSDEKGFKGHLTTITLDPDLIVRPASGKTASEIQIERDRKQLNGAIQSSFNRIGRQEGVAQAIAKLNGVVDNIISTAQLDEIRHLENNI